MYPRDWYGVSPRSASSHHTCLISQIRCRPSASQRKSHALTSNQSVISVGKSAARPRRKNRRKSSEKVSRWRGRRGGSARGGSDGLAGDVGDESDCDDDWGDGREAAGLSTLGFTSTPGAVRDTARGG